MVHQLQTVWSARSTCALCGLDSYIVDQSLPSNDELKSELHVALINGAGVAELFNLIVQKIQWTGNDPPRLLIVKHMMDAFSFDRSIFTLTKHATNWLDYSAESGWTVNDWDGEELLLALKSKATAHND